MERRQSAKGAILRLLTGALGAGVLFIAASVAFSTAGPVAHASEMGSIPPLGQPDQVGLVVSDPVAAKDQLEEAMGVNFNEDLTSTVDVELESRAVRQKISLQSSVTENGYPQIEVTRASPAVGPWAIAPGKSATYLSYAVSNPDRSAARLRRAGWHRLAASKTFSFWKGAGGLLVRIRQSHKKVSIDESGPSPAAIALYPCNVSEMQGSLTKALGVNWLAQQTYTLPWTLPDGSIRLHTSTSSVTNEGEPFLALEPPHDFPGENMCSSSATPSYLVFTAGDVGAAESRLGHAGMTPIATVPGMIGAYRGVNDLFVEVVSPSFLPSSQ